MNAHSTQRLTSPHDLMPHASALSALMHTLIWEGGPFRFVFEGLLVLILYHQGVLLFYLIDPSVLQVSAAHVAILAALALVVMYWDSRYLMAGFSKFQVGFKEACKGDLFKALEALHLSQGAFFPPPHALVLLQLAEYERMLGEDARFERSITSARDLGVSSQLCLFHRIRAALFAGVKGDSSALAPSPNDELIVELERAMYMLSQGTDLAHARVLFQKVLTAEPKSHPSLASTTDLALVGKLCVDLQLGRAESALNDLSYVLPVLVSHSESNAGIRPYAAIFLLERAKYFARNRSGRRTDYDRRRLHDVQTALSICRFPVHTMLAEQLS